MSARGGILRVDRRLVTRPVYDIVDVVQQTGAVNGTLSEGPANASGDLHASKSHLNGVEQQDTGDMLLNGSSSPPQQNNFASDMAAGGITKESFLTYFFGGGTKADRSALPESTVSTNAGGVFDMQELERQMDNVRIYNDMIKSHFLLDAGTRRLTGSY